MLVISIGIIVSIILIFFSAVSDEPDLRKDKQRNYVSFILYTMGVMILFFSIGYLVGNGEF